MGESKELTVLTATLNPLVVFGDGGVDSILDQITKEVRAIETDISTPTGRKELASLAFKIARSKTALDDMGKALVADWKLRSASVDAERRRIREALDALKDEVRRPLTEWEQAETDRVKAHETALLEIVALSSFDHPEPTAETIKARLGTVLDGEASDWRDWQEFTKRATEARAAAISSLQALLSSTEKREAERAELERLRKERVEREQRERDDKLRAEAAEKAIRAAELEAAGRARLAAEKADAEKKRIEREKQEAVTRAEKAEKDNRGAEARAKADAERAVEAERKRVKEKAEKEAAEVARREANKKHRAKIHREILAALVAAGLREDSAADALRALTAGEIPHIEIVY